MLLDMCSLAGRFSSRQVFAKRRYTASAAALWNREAPRRVVATSGRLSRRDMMRALTVNPGQPCSLSLDEVPPPPESDGAVLVRAMALGICGTDREIIEGLYGSAPDGAKRLIIGHESLGQVEQAPAECGVARGDLVVGIVRR